MKWRMFYFSRIIQAEWSMKSCLFVGDLVKLKRINKGICDLYPMHHLLEKLILVEPFRRVLGS